MPNSPDAILRESEAEVPPGSPATETNVDYRPVPALPSSSFAVSTASILPPVTVTTRPSAIYSPTPASIPLTNISSATTSPNLFPQNMTASSCRTPSAPVDEFLLGEIVVAARTLCKRFPFCLQHLLVFSPSLAAYTHIRVPISFSEGNIMKIRTATKITTPIVLLTAAFALTIRPAVAQDTKIQGVIDGRSGATMSLKTVNSPPTLPSSSPTPPTSARSKASSTAARSRCR